jgi:hypothetical protein
MIEGGARVSEQEQLDELRAQHAKLKQDISNEYARPDPDDQRIAALKVQKLGIKDQIAELERV